VKKLINEKFVESLLRKPVPKGRPIIHDKRLQSYGVRAASDHWSYVIVKRIGGAKQPSVRKIGKVGVIAPDKAREKAKTWLELIDRGIDPAVEEAAAVEARRVEALRQEGNTHAARWLDYKELRLSQVKDHAERARLVERDVLPDLGDVAFDAEDKVIRRRISEIANKIYRRGAHYVAARVSDYVSPFYSWGVDQGFRDSNPLFRFKGPLAEEVKRKRVLTDGTKDEKTQRETDNEIVAFWRACGRIGMSGHAARYLLVTLARRDEVGEARQAEIHDGVWVIPGERTKNGEERVLPLPPLALRILEETPQIGDTYVFSTAGAKPLNGWSKAKERLDAAMLEELRKLAEEHGKDPAKVELRPWRIHDLRRTGATGLGKLGFSDTVIREALGQADNRGVLGTYERSDRTPEVKVALAAWSQRLELLISGGGTVVPMRRSRKR
jgi:integrase